MKTKIKVLITIFIFFIISICSNEVYAQELTIKNNGGKEITSMDCNVGDTIDVYMCINLTWDMWAYSAGVKDWDTNFLTGEWTTIDGDVLDFYVEYKWTMKIKKAGKITLEFYNDEETGVFGLFSNTATSTLTLNITDPVAEAEAEKKKMEEAYKTVPAMEADANTIDIFIKSYATYVEGLSTKEEKTKAWEEFKEKVKSKATNWIVTLESEMIDTISRQLYMESKNLLEDYVNGTGNFTEHSKNLSDQMNSAINSTNTTIQRYKERIAAVLADEGEQRGNVTFIDVLDNVDNYIPSDNLSSADAKKMERKISTILSVITSIGMLLSVIMPAIIGVKYMLGSIEEKAEYKKDMVPYLVGAVLLFGICTIVKIVQAFGRSINNI